MSYNRMASALLDFLGFANGRLPVDGMAPRFVNTWIYPNPRTHTPEPINNLEVWINPLPPMPEGRRFKRSTHRLMCKCPRCGSTLSVGRLHQHYRTTACNVAANVRSVSRAENV